MSSAASERADVVVVGSGAGGGLVAASLGSRGHDVLLLEAGGYHSAADHTRFELRANHRLWWPMRFAQTRDDGREPLALLAGRCVGGTTVVNTKVSFRAAAFDVAKFYQQTGLTGEDGKPFGLSHLDPYYQRVEFDLGVRVRADWPPSVMRLRPAFAAMGASLEPVESYTDYNCSRCGSCLQGCPTNAGKNALNVYIAPALARNEIRLQTGVSVERVLVDHAGPTPRVTGLDYVGPGGAGRIRASTVVLAAGALNTPQILLNSPDYRRIDSVSTRLVGRTLGLHPARLVYGLFDEPQDCHMVYPITAHCLDYQNDDAGGFVVEATTIQDPAMFATSLVDEQFRPIWGDRLVSILRNYRRWAGALVMVNDDNTATIEPDGAGGNTIRKRFSATEQRRLDQALAFTLDVLRRAGASETVFTGLGTAHQQGSARMGGDPSRSVVDASGRSHDVEGLYIADGSLVPASLSVNPSLTIMALAAKVADALAARLEA